MTKFSTAIFEKIEAERVENSEAKRLKLLEKAKQVLASYFTTIKVDCLYLTGSVIEPNRFRNHSDIDIAVKGLDGSLYFKAISDLEGLLDRKVEIIELENCRFTEKIYNTGLKLK